MPKVSIIVPCCNAERYLSQTIESVLGQTFTDWEMAIVDDGGADRSAEIAGEHAARDSRIRLIRQENRGVNAARNAGFGGSAPSAAYLLFLDADDILSPAFLAAMAMYLDSHPEAGMAFCRYQTIDENGNALSDERCELPRYTLEGGRLHLLPEREGRVPFDTAFWWIDLPIMSALMRRTVYERLPGWDEDFGHGLEDTDLLLRFFLAGEVHAVPDTLVSYRRHGAQATRRGWWMKRQRGMLHEKWLAGVGLSEEEARRFRAQWQSYEGAILPRYLLGQSASHLAHGRILRSAKQAVRSAAHLAISRTTGCRRLVWPYLWYLA